MTQQEREQIFKEKAKTYVLCFSHTCPMREHCLHQLLNQYASKTDYVKNCVNLNNPNMQQEGCPFFASDESVVLQVGISPIYYDMPYRIEKPLKSHLISLFTRKRYYDYHTGRLPMPPKVERIVRKAALAYGWTTPLEFDHSVETFLW